LKQKLKITFLKGFISLDTSTYEKIFKQVLQKLLVNINYRFGLKKILKRRKRNQL
jgi:hypothetical protein